MLAAGASGSEGVCAIYRTVASGLITRALKLGDPECAAAAAASRDPDDVGLQKLCELRLRRAENNNPHHLMMFQPATH